MRESIRLGSPAPAGEYRGDTLSQSYLLKYGYDTYGNRYQRLSEDPHDQNNNPADPFSQSWVEDGSYNPTTNRLNSGVTSDSRFRMLSFRYDANDRQQQSSARDESGL